MTDIIPMQLQCSRCGTRIYNDDPTIRTAPDFLRAAEERGWVCEINPPRPPRCPKCVVSL
jgi:hypothetical protein